ncbi:hypothetical protein GQ457_01G047570 [Hibiscus cannabinus]
MMLKLECGRKCTTKKKRKNSAVSFGGLRRLKHQGERQYEKELQNRQFTYSGVQRITNNFEKVIGKGGFGTVYHGFLEEKQVAVKMYTTTNRLTEKSDVYSFGG